MRNCTGVHSWDVKLYGLPSANSAGRFVSVTADMPVDTLDIYICLRTLSSYIYCRNLETLLQSDKKPYFFDQDCDWPAPDYTLSKSDCSCS